MYLHHFGAQKWDENGDFGPFFPRWKGQVALEVVRALGFGFGHPTTIQTPVGVLCDTTLWCYQTFEV